MIWDFWAPKLASLWAAVSYWLILYVSIGILLSIFMVIVAFVKAYRVAYVHRTGTFSDAFQNKMPDTILEALVGIMVWPIIAGAILYDVVTFILNKLTFKFNFGKWLEKKLDARDRKNNPERYV